MLNYFLEHNLVTYCDEQPKDWRDAIQKSCELLLEKSIINQTYIDEVISCVEKYGPYIVIVPGVAMPHSSEDSEGVFGTAISFTKMPAEVVFDEADPEKNASLFFTLAAKNSAEHMENIANLSEMLMEEGLIEALEGTNSLADFIEVKNKFAP